jgi:putative component of membrane protein insertase Oxa1/YidC/SpoIIIJ protein YidD
MRIFIIILFVSCWLAAAAQTKTELMLVRTTQSNALKSGHVHEHEDHSVSMSSLIFGFYKKTLSSQDYYSCNFSPSCSEHAFQAVTKQGLFIGMLNSFDRLTRCHGLNRHSYQVDPKTLLLLDPVRDAHFKTL